MRDYDAMRLMVNSRGKLPTVILKYPTDRYGFAGGIPVELTTPRETMFGTQHDSNVFDTEQEAIDALLNLGITHFQLSNSEWYK